MEIREVFSGGRQRGESLKRGEGAEGGEGIDSLSSVKEGAHSALAILYEHAHSHTHTHTHTRKDESQAK